MSYTLPKIWQGRIQKYWDKIMPTGYPVSDSTFELKFDSEEVTAAVNEFEASLDDPESVVADLLPENTVISNYIGTYNVSGESGVKTLLSPEKVETDNVIALHYDEESTEWEEIEDISVEDGYVWGTLESFSPIAIVEYRKDIHVETKINGQVDGNYVVCEGNVVKITQDDDGVVTLKSESTGTSIVLEGKHHIVGGSADGTPIDSTSITIVGVNNYSVIDKVYGGSCYWDDAEVPTPTTVGTINVNIQDSRIGCLTGSSGMVRTNTVNFNLNNFITSWAAVGESWSTPKKKDASPGPDCSFASNSWVKNAYITGNNITIPLMFCSGNTGYLYVDHNEATITDSKVDYFISGGSNGGTNTSDVSAIGCKIQIYQSTNRGFVHSAKAKFNGCTISNLFIGGDATDDTVTGTTDYIRVDINGSDGKYNIVNGTEAGKLLTKADVERIVDVVKVPRSTDITISKEELELLGDKYIVK
jgi:hypothetical protein